MLTITNLHKSFGDHEVVKGVSLQIEKGETFGLLGPNGAGKSTTISMISGLVPFTKGEIEVDGISIKKQSQEVKEKIGVVPQDIALYPTMSALDNLIFWGKMYGLKGSQVKHRAKEVLEMVGLSSRAKDRVETFSGGMKRRVNIGAALMHSPELLIMDEPTVGIDPQSRNHILETVKNLNKAGMTIIYTSHYMEEVEYLCERIGIMDKGHLIAIGSKRELNNRLSTGEILHVEVAEVRQDFVEQLQEVKDVEKVLITNEKNLEIYTTNQRNMLADIVSCAAELDIPIIQIKVQEANLETLFLQLTGRKLRD